MKKIQLIGKLSVKVVDLNNEIKQLKELLGECRGCFDYLGVDDVMINKIDEVLK